MSKRRGRVLIIAVLWLVSLGILAAAILLFNDTRLSRRTGFPYMPLYGAVTWWFFLTIPVIGLTWGLLNDLKRDD